MANLKDTIALKQETDIAEAVRILTSFSPAKRGKAVNYLRELNIPAEKSLSILLTGKTGTGKSTLTNGILGVNFAKEGSSIGTRSTTQVGKYTVRKEDIDLTVWDSPGLQDGTSHQQEYLEQMAEHCSEVDLTLFCIKVEPRFVHGTDNPDVLAMKKFTEAFGPDFWKNTIIVLTFANVLEAFNIDWEDLSPEEKEKWYQAKIKKWRDKIWEILIQDIQVPEDIVKAVKIVPAGHHKKPDLPGFPRWLSSLWIECITTIPNKEARLNMLKISKNRLMRETDVKKEDFTKPPEQQPIVLSDKMIEMMMTVGSQAIGAYVAGKSWASFGMEVAGSVVRILFEYLDSFEE